MAKLRSLAQQRKAKMDAAINGPTAVKATKKTTVTKTPTGKVKSTGKASVTVVPKDRKPFKVF